MLPHLTVGSLRVLLPVAHLNSGQPMTGEIEGGQKMTGDEVRAAFEELLPQAEMNRLGRQCGVIERQRKLNLAMLGRAMAIAAGTPGGAYQADIWRASLESEVPLQIDESWRGYGLRADLACASLADLRACETCDVRFVMRLKDNWEPKVEYIARGQVTREFFPGTHLDALRAEDSLRLDGRAIDADVRVGGGTNPLPLRLVGVQTPKGYGFFLTNLPPRIGPLQVADLYRVRWEVELSSKLDKSVHRLDQIDAERPCSLKTLLHASLVASTIAAVLAHRHNLNTRPQQAGASRPEAPLHRRLFVAKGGVLSGHRPSLRAEGSGGQAAVGQNR
jgi:hypothetical protein